MQAVKECKSRWKLHDHRINIRQNAARRQSSFKRANYEHLYGYHSNEDNTIPAEKIAYICKHDG
jgi:hypothetical protein